MTFPITQYVREDYLSPDEYLELMRTAPEKIKRRKFVLPKPGRLGDYGHFFVEYHWPEKKEVPYDDDFSLSFQGNPYR